MYSHPGQTAPLPGSLYFVSPRTLGLPERFHQVCNPNLVVMFDVSNILNHYNTFNLIFLSQLLFSAGGQWAGDEGTGQTLVSSAGAHAS